MFELKYQAERIAKLYREKKLSLTTAESCTGGQLSYYLTSIPGSSNWFERGFVTYTNEAKIEMLGVKPATLEKYGAVSEATAVEMLAGALQHSHADIAVSITGIAGPGGSTPEKPVGTVWLAWGGNNLKTITQCFHFQGDRQQVRDQTCFQALSQMIKCIT
ncbi:MAG: CinA family protein [Pseudomonadota bacterium]